MFDDNAIPERGDWIGTWRCGAGHDHRVVFAYVGAVLMSVKDDGTYLATDTGSLASAHAAWTLLVDEAKERMERERESTPIHDQLVMDRAADVLALTKHVADIGW